jgi:hypothetical protein
MEGLHAASAPADASPVPLLVTAGPLVRGLSETMLRALQEELCPDEKLQLVVRPSPARVAGIRWTLLSPMGLLSTILFTRLVVGPELAWEWLFWTAMGCLTAWGLRKQRPNFAYVVTDQRCFRLSRRGGRVHVVDVDHPPSEMLLDPDDVEELDRRIRELDQRLGARRRRSSRRAHPVRELPAALREAVRSQLKEGEALVWADRPDPRDFFMHAKLDATSVWLMIAGLVALVAAIASASGLSLPLSTLALGCAAAGTTGTALARVWRQVRGTVYALTDHRGLILSPGGRVTAYMPNELKRFHRTQNDAGQGRLGPPDGGDGEGFYGVRNVKVLDDLIKNRTAREQSTEVTPAEAPGGRGDEMAAAG